MRWFAYVCAMIVLASSQPAWASFDFEPFSAGSKFDTAGGRCTDSKPVIAISPTNLVFANTSTGQTRTARISVTNSGSAAWTGIGYSNFASNVFAHVTAGQSPCGTSLAAGATCNHDVSCTPVDTSTATDGFSFTSDQFAAKAVTVSCKGISAVNACDGYKVRWAMTQNDLDCFNATDGSTTTTSGITYSADGATFDANTDYARFNVTNGNSINQDLWEIGFRYKKTGTPASYAYFVDHSAATNELAIVRNGTSNNQFRVYSHGTAATITSTVTSVFDGAEHVIVATYNKSTNTATISVDGEIPVSGALSASTHTLSTGYLNVGGNVAGTTGCMGIMSDFYIK